VPYATTDATIIRKYWTDWPNAAIAVETGKWDAQNIIAVMITREDVNAPQTDRWGPARPPEWVQMEGEAESHTVMFRRGKRDVCLFRAGPGGVLDGKLKLAEGVTIFGKGEYVRLPDSFDAEYEDRFEPGCAVGEVDLAPVPKWLARDIRRARGDHSDETSTLPTRFEHIYIPFDSIAVFAYVHNDEQVKLIAESIKVTGLRKPLTVRQLTDCSFGLLSDPHQLEALESLGMDYCDCIVLKVDEKDGRLWQIAELLRQPELSPLDWAELIMEWVQLVREKDAQVEHPVGGVQPRNKGLSRAGRVLGVSRSDVQRAEKIASISAAAKAEIRRLNLRVQQDMLKIREAPPDEQVAMVQQLAAPQPRTVTLRGGPPRKDPQRAKPSDTAPSARDSTQTEKPTRAEDEPEGREGEVVGSPPMAPTEIVDPLEIPAALRRTDGERQYEAFKSRWVQYCEADFKALPAPMQARFATEVHEMSVLATGNGEESR